MHRLPAHTVPSKRWPDARGRQSWLRPSGRIGCILDRGLADAAVAGAGR